MWCYSPLRAAQSAGGAAPHDCEVSTLTVLCDGLHVSWRWRAVCPPAHTSDLCIDIVFHIYGKASWSRRCVLSFEYRERPQGDSRVLRRYVYLCSTVLCGCCGVPMDRRLLALRSPLSSTLHLIAVSDIAGRLLANRRIAIAGSDRDRRRT